jgi:hypothetical protein
MYYIAKRLFLFLDEWLFYYTLYKLVRMKYYKITAIVLLYGFSCIYTSYTNIERVETKLTGVHQMIWLTDTSPLDYIKKFGIVVVDIWRYGSGLIYPT